MIKDINAPAMIIMTGLMSKKPTNTATITAIDILLVKLSPFFIMITTLDKISAAIAGLIPEKISSTMAKFLKSLKNIAMIRMIKKEGNTVPKRQLKAPVNPLIL